MMRGKRSHTTEVGKYTLTKELGKGAFSVVRLGKNKETDQEVAVKVIGKNKMRNKRQDAVLRNEIEVMSRIAKIKHPHLVQMTDVFEDERALYICLEVLAGGELFDRIVERGHYSERDASILVAQLAHALKALHDSNVLHRDLKPENLLYDGPGEDSKCKITDFGLAFITEASDVHRSLVGTPGYVAPEVLSRREYGPACDVWGLGVILYILLVGYPPFYAETNSELFEIIKRGEYYFHEDAWGEISESARDLVARMLTLDTRERITTDGVLQHPWVVEYNKLSDAHLPKTVAQLKQFNARRRFRTAAMACIVGAMFGRRKQLQELLGPDVTLPTAEVSRVQGAFRRVAEGDAVTLEQFRQVLTSLDMGHLPIDRLFTLFDTDGDGTVDYKEFLVGLSTIRGNNEGTVKMCFDIFDEDKSGFITRDELAKVLRSVAEEEMATEMADSDKLAKLFERLDSNNDNQISFEEFKVGVHAEPVLKRAFFGRSDSASGSA